MSASGGGGGGGGVREVLVDMECEYTRELVSEALRALTSISDYHVVDALPNTRACTERTVLRWSDYENLDDDWPAVMERRLSVNFYCVRKALIRKAQLAHYVHKYVTKHPDSVLATHVPESWPFELDHPEYLDEALTEVPEVAHMRDGEAVWCLKPSVTNQGFAICIFDRLADLYAFFADPPDDWNLDMIREWVFQRYVDRPLLIGGRKFHLRTYIMAIGCVSVFVFTEMLALFALQPYRSTRESFSDKYAHITNTCLQQGADDFAEDEAVHCLSELDALLVAQGTHSADAAERWRADVVGQVCRVTGELFRSLSTELAYMPMPNCFELYGVDFLVDADNQVQLLEVNAGPNFVMTGERLRDTVPGPFLRGVASIVTHVLLDKRPLDQLDTPDGFVLVFDKQNPVHLGASSSGVRVE